MTRGGGKGEKKGVLKMSGTLVGKLRSVFIARRLKCELKKVGSYYVSRSRLESGFNVESKKRGFASLWKRRLGLFVA